MKVLVTGGAGYIGSVVASQLLDADHDVVVLDDLSTGHADAVDGRAAFVKGTLREQARPVLASGGFDAVLHFAAKSLVGESVERPDVYWDGNLGETLALLDAMRATGVKKIVFSSTAAVYGEPETVPITEDAPARPGNPYGATKLAIDVALTEFARLNGFGAVSLRYFNVAGAHGALAERHAVETHLIPNVLRAAVTDEPVSVFGSDYSTADGTCVRDYIHVTDLGRAHLLALAVCEPGAHMIYNLGNGAGYSVQEVIEVCRQVTGRPIAAMDAPRRPGDPDVLIASSEAIRADLGWEPVLGLTTMVEDAWREFPR
ncbi:UDP-glucose 4-epimerase GalE [Actinocorallia aurantiaca]|uniref:UDP-glucose 4-epimerase n=1 Tax=Actinocorallia aurantiaca TaxID=46204 RepID=A0ABP6H8A7_9ACTN